MGAVALKSYSFAISIVGLYKIIRSEHQEFVLSKQILRSGTAIGALVSEAEHAQSRADFLNKINIALKEANETKYWLALLSESSYIDQRSFVEINEKCDEILRLLVSIVKTTKLSLKR